MKSYLSLISISAKVHRRQNRLTLLCIVFAVFMVTAVFSMAEMGARMEYSRLLGKHGKLSMADLLGSYMGQSLLLVACALFLLILIAGVLMISSSMNSTVAQRIEFFGMMRCIGMSKQQIVRFVRLEALNWCKTAVPIGLVMGIATTWGLCAALRFLVGEEFSYIPLFGISNIGIVCGILVGVITVLIAANAPARRASKVSPVAAVSGNIGSEKTVRYAANTCFGRIETILGINHAVSKKKNLILMTVSFALSIILFLSFSVFIDLVNYLMPQSVATSDIDIASNDGNTIPNDLLITIQGMDGVKEVYGRRSALDLPGSLDNDASSSDTVDLISYDDFNLQSLRKDGNLKKGSDLAKVYGNSGFVLATSDADSTWKIGDTIQIQGETLTIAGLLKNDPFSSDGLTHGKITLISSSDTFVRLTGEENYALIMVQTTSGATDEDVQAIQTVAGETFNFQDMRDGHTSGTYTAFVFCVYAFLSIIALVTVLNIVNSISMSVSARMKQYGAMRAVGMNERQVTKMIAAEAATYAVLGCAVGCIIGLPLSKLLYDSLIARHFPYAVWNFPIGSLIIILLFVSLAVVAAIHAPAKRIRSMPITATINEL
ncbi:ABC transporter permease [Roseburia sp. 499]|uniref:ABC transporter permease n=1 Tax=Roseburia sp. 499 TaxID=1261634 RepID=UPI000950EF02|nr:ABC transporter permease [Roseburia sp. 499]WVK70188.1 FtsX-like permease family protein [Roseburia sp. 499]